MNTFFKSSLAIAIVSATLATAPAFADDQPMTLATINQAKVSLIDAINRAEQATKATAISAEFEQGYMSNQYEIKLISANGIELERYINTQTGEVTAPTFADNDYDREDQQIVAALNSGKVQTLVAAIKQTEAEFNSKVYDIELDMHHGKIGYEAKGLTANGRYLETRF